MNALLTKLGVPPGVQAFFNADELWFNYSGHFEHFTTGFHLVPTTQNLFVAGSRAAKELIIASSVMEAMAFLTLMSHRYPNLYDLSVIAMGNLPYPDQLYWIKSRWQKRKITLVFGNDVLGRLTDIKVAAGIRNKLVRFSLQENRVAVTCNHIHYRFDPDMLTLNQFEKTAGIRTGIRTAKPKKFDTYLDQLQYDANQRNIT
jgi:hypothetical protein